MNLDESAIEEKMEEAFEGWKAIQDLERMTIRDVYECAFRHGVEAAKEFATG